MTSMAAVRIGFAAIMMFPLSSGFSVGQAGVMQVAGWGIGMARTLYANAVKAIGPDAMVIADPIIPGTRTIVLGLIEDELCRSLINQATATTLVPAPTPTVVNSGKGAVVTYAYSLAAGKRHGVSDMRLGFGRQLVRRAGDARRRDDRHGDPAAVDPRRHRQLAQAPDQLDRPVLLAEQDPGVVVAASEPLPERDPDLYAATDERSAERSPRNCGRA